MKPQTKTIIAGLAAVAGAKFYLNQEWKAAAIFGAAVALGYLILSDLPDSTTE